MLVLQIITIIWSKATRGAPRAKERTVLPRSFAIDALELIEEDCVVHCVEMAESASFVPTQRIEARVLPQISTYGALRIRRIDDENYELALSQGSLGGQPQHRPGPRTLRLQAGQYARLMINARHTSYSGQYYSETIYNFCFGKRIPRERFLQPKPDLELDLKVDLF
jgi:hypothetical protein